MKTFLIIGITLVAGLFIAGAFAVSTAGSTSPPAAAVLIDKTITANGIYDASDDGADGFSQVTVNVPATTPDLTEKTITANGIYDASDDGADGFSQVTVNVPTGLPVRQTELIDCGGTNSTPLILNRFYATHYEDEDASGDLILNVCGVYWDVRQNRISLDNGLNWIIGRGVYTSYSGYESWQLYLINLPNPNLGVIEVTNTLQFVELSEFVFGAGAFENYTDGEFHPLTPALNNWSFTGPSAVGEAQVANIGFLVNEGVNY